MSNCGGRVWEKHATAVSVSVSPLSQAVEWIAAVDAYSCWCDALAADKSVRDENDMGDGGGGGACEGEGETPQFPVLTAMGQMDQTTPTDQTACRDRLDEGGVGGDGTHHQFDYV